MDCNGLAKGRATFSNRSAQFAWSTLKRLNCDLNPIKVKILPSGEHKAFRQKFSFLLFWSRTQSNTAFYWGELCRLSELCWAELHRRNNHAGNENNIASISLFLCYSCGSYSRISSGPRKFNERLALVSLMVSRNPGIILLPWFSQSPIYRPLLIVSDNCDHQPQP